MQKQKDSSFFVIRTMAISFLVVVGSLALLPSVQAHAQGSHVASSGIVMNTVVYDVTHNRYSTYNASTLFVTGSSMKVPIMLTFFDMIEREGRQPTTYEYGLLKTMIENSNNDSASALYYGEIGGAAGVASYMNRIGISGLYPNPHAWGWSRIYPSTMVHLLTRLYNGTILTASHRSLALYYMEHVEADQRVGVGDTAPKGATVALKDGWVVAPDGLWAMNSSGIVKLGRQTYVIASYTREDPSLLAGQNAVRQICAQVASQLG
jgi:beta-lactamase class A